MGHIENVEEKARTNSLDVNYNWDFTINVSWVALGAFSAEEHHNQNCAFKNNKGHCGEHIEKGGC